MRGADVAEAGGELAAYAALADIERHVPQARIALLRRKMARGARFAKALQRIFPVPHYLAEALADDTVLCRCEMVSATGPAPRGTHTRRRRDQSRQGADARRHGPLPGPLLRSHRHDGARRRGKGAGRAGDGTACPGAGQAGADRARRERVRCRRHNPRTLPIAFGMGPFPLPLKGGEG